MRNKTFVFALLTTAVTICLTIDSCKKHDKASNLIVGKWIMSAYIHDGMEVYGTGQLDPCVTDDIITFTSGQQLIINQGPIKCYSSEPQTITGTYSLTSDNMQLTLSAITSSEVDSIRTLNSTTLKLEQITNGDIITYTRIP